ncbi:MAG: hypothetical protein LW854_23845 [Rubrivivax sp.]|nr:hypothetical protein [Rubrivivax sp.]
MNASGAATTGLQVQGNYIGTGIAGTTSIANGSGVRLTGGAAATIGGATTAHRNVIAGGLGHGVEINANGSAAVTVSGNYIKTAPPAL